MKRVDLNILISNLDDTWRTPAGVRRLMKRGGSDADIACMLERLALIDRVEHRYEETEVRRALVNPGRGKVFRIHFYRRLQ